MASSARDLAYFLLAVSLAGWLLWVGADILWPLAASVVLAYVLIALDRQIENTRFIGKMPGWVRKLAIAIVFALFVFIIAAVVGSTIDQLTAAAPQYQANLSRMIEDLSARFGFEKIPSWETIRSSLSQQISFQSLLTSALGQVASMGGQIVMIIFYSIFLLAERGGFAQKLFNAVGNREQAEEALRVITAINHSISDYLATKTMINIILGAVSYLVMLMIGIDFAAFWAIAIGLMNYIPYVGSIVGVAFPALLSLAQFGSIGTTLIAAVALTVVQVIIGYVVEPRMIGSSVNLSPFVILVALTIWSALWGIPGAILAVPLTAIIAIILAARAETRGVAIMMSADGRAGKTGGELL